MLLPETNTKSMKCAYHLCRFQSLLFVEAYLFYSIPYRAVLRIGGVTSVAELPQFTRVASDIRPTRYPPFFAIRLQVPDTEYPAECQEEKKSVGVGGKIFFSLTVSGRSKPDLNS